MDKKQLGLLVIAVVAGLAAAAFIGKYVTDTITQKEAQIQEESDAKTKQIVQAMEQKAAADKAALQAEIARQRAEQDQAMQKQMADLKLSIQKNPQTIKKPKPSLAVKTPAGKRAVTIKVESLGAVGGLLNPGDSVDVIARLSVPGIGDKKNTVTAMIFQGLEVLAVNTNLEETGIYYDEQQKAPDLRITVAVDPEEAGLLSFADKNGKMELALRSPQESERQMVKASTWKTLADYVLQNQGADIDLPDSLKGIQQSTTEEPERPDIQIFRGGKEL